MPMRVGLHTRTADGSSLNSQNQTIHSTPVDLKFKVRCLDGQTSSLFTIFLPAALLTYKIRNLWSHLTKYKRDIANRRSLRKLVHQRAKVLRYLRQTDRDRYETVLSRLALEPE